MPKYQFHRLPEVGKDAEPIEQVLFDDTAALRRAIGAEFPDGCDVWQDSRFVGRFHRAAGRAVEVETTDA